ncbi:MAG: hypothetical protein IT423_21260, partial [Pirellulaceae bacterium]|nr:hypothetical protein [Pirellulaceae bacterium]
LAYAVAGQASTLLMGLLGVLVLGAITSSPSNSVTLANLLDLQTGWSANAWASQLVWVNGFLFLLHMLPAAPFDARAFFVGWCHVSSPTMSAGAIHRSLATTDSMIGCSLGGFSAAMIVTRMADMDSAAIWCVLLVVAIYLLSVSRIEQFQALQDDELSEPPLPRVWRQRPRPVAFGNELQELGEFDTFQAPSAHEVLDVDEILRKLHREGQDSLSAFEKEALLSASRELQARRQSRSAGGR